MKKSENPLSSPLLSNSTFNQTTSGQLRRSLPSTDVFSSTVSPSRNHSVSYSLYFRAFLENSMALPAPLPAPPPARPPPASQHGLRPRRVRPRQGWRQRPPPSAGAGPRRTTTVRVAEIPAGSRGGACWRRCRRRGCRHKMSLVFLDERRLGFAYIPRKGVILLTQVMVCTIHISSEI